ncbi:MAG: hypothetical protein LQ343_006199 [Gyalolechia ehrenbergii]|nr:MAG: hypothetical protein LQ343_006199 [Gyalolechia ehrenbergii]
MASLPAINALAWCASRPPTWLHVLVPILLLATLAVTSTRRASKQSSQIPEVHHGWPVVGNVIAYSKNPISFLRKATAQYGNMFKTEMIFTSVIWLRSPKLNKIYLETKEHTWGINRTATLDHYSDLARETSRTFLANWAGKEEIDLFEHVSKLVHAIIVKCLMGPDFDAKNGEELYSLLHGMETDIGSVFNFILPGWVPHPAALRLRQQKDRVGAIFQERLKERRAHPERWTDSQDYISYTLNDSVTAHLSPYYASHHTMLMFAAHTSTVASISWTILELLKSPERLDSLRRELCQGSDYRSSPYLQACLKETVRRYSGISMFRHARQSTVLPGTNITVPKGSVVSISGYLTHRDPNIYPDADEWTPERWVKKPDLARRLNSGDQLAYIPFGAGAHRCPGEKMAGLIGSAVIGTFAQDYDVEWGKVKADLTKLDFSKVGSPWLKGDTRVSIKRRET